MRLRFASSALLSLALACGTAPAPAPTTPGIVAARTAALPPVAVVAAASEADAIVPILANDPTWGSRLAPVTVVLFGDFQCPFTGRILPTVKALEAKYGPDDLRFVWKELPLPFHDKARPAAEAAEAVYLLGQNDAFFRFWEAALSHQATLSPAAFEAWAQDAGVDVASYRRIVDAHGAAAKIDEGRALAEKLGVVGTPTFVINGLTVEGAQPLENLTAVVDLELAKAKAKVAAGTAPDAVYAEMAKANWKPPQPDADDGPREDEKTVWNVPVAGSPVRGPAAAPVTIIEFSDFQCPYCKRAEATLTAVRTKYGDKVRIVWKDEPLPFHPRALPAAEAAREARAEKGDPGFWALHDAIFTSQPKLEDADLVAAARSVGLDAARVKSAVATRRYASKIAADTDLADDVQAAGTPHFFINGRRLVGAQPVEKFSAIIDEEIAHAGALVAGGTAPTAVYDTIAKGGQGPVMPEVHVVPPRAGAPFKGPEGARVVIEEFADFECPFCGRAEATLAEVTRTYGPKVKIVWRNLPLPFHPHARACAEAALEAQRQKGNAGFWAMHDKLFLHRAEDGGLERAALDGYAKELHMDVAAFDRALDASAHADAILADTTAAESAKINGTPAFVVGGYLISGAQPFAKFRRVIDAVLANGPAAGAR